MVTYLDQNRQVFKTSPELFFLFSYTGRVKVVFSNFIRSLAALWPLEVKRTCMTVDKQRPTCVHILEYLTGITSLRWPIVSFSALGPQTLPLTSRRRLWFLLPRFKGGAAARHCSLPGGGGASES
jgi:hypothetical protein